MNTNAMIDDTSFKNEEAPMSIFSCTAIYNIYLCQFSQCAAAGVSLYWIVNDKCHNIKVIICQNTIPNKSPHSRVALRLSSSASSPPLLYIFISLCLLMGQKSAI